MSRRPIMLKLVSSTINYKGSNYKDRSAYRFRRLCPVACVELRYPRQLHKTGSMGTYRAGNRQEVYRQDAILVTLSIMHACGLYQSLERQQRALRTRSIDRPYIPKDPHGDTTGVRWGDQSPSGHTTTRGSAPAPRS